MAQSSVRNIYSKMSAKFLIFLCLVLFGATVLSPPSAGAAENSAILVSINGLTFADIEADETPNFDRVIETGGVGLMNARSAKHRNRSNFYLSIGAGARAESGKSGRLGFNADETLPVDLFGSRLTAADLIWQTRRLSIPDDAIINIGITEANKASIRYQRPIVPGLLGEALKQAGKKSAVLGNADTLNIQRREISLITMDQSGQTTFGDVSSSTNRLDRRFPGGLRTDFENLSLLVTVALEKADFVAIELGDLPRIDDMRSIMSDTAYLQSRRRAIKDIDSFLGVLINARNSTNDLLVITSPQPQIRESGQLDLLPPVIISGKGSGALSSNTTKRKSLIANVDIAPTLLDHIGAPIPIEMAGSIATIVPETEPVKLAISRHSQIFALRQVRTPALITFLTLMILVLSASVLVVRLESAGVHLPAHARNIVKFALLALTAIPLTSMFYMTMDEGNIAVSLASFAAITLSVAGLTLWLSGGRPLAPLAILAALTVLVVAGDALIGSPLSQRSFFGSDLVAGGRYYGLGNTLMGVLVGASIFTLVALMDLGLITRKLWRPVLGLTGLAVVAVIVGHPDAGANAGGLIATAGGAVIFAQVLSEGRLTVVRAAAGLSIFLAIVAIVLIVDLPSSDSQSHIGKSMEIIEANGGGAVSDIVIRKIRMNSRGAASIRGYALVVLAGLAYLLGRTLGATRNPFSLLRADYPITTKGFSALIWAGALVLAVNDTGVVGALSISIYALVPFFFLVLSLPRLGVDEFPNEQTREPSEKGAFP